MAKYTADGILYHAKNYFDAALQHFKATDNPPRTFSVFRENSDVEIEFTRQQLSDFVDSRNGCEVFTVMDSIGTPLYWKYHPKGTNLRRVFEDFVHGHLIGTPEDNYSVKNVTTGLVQEHSIFE
jgi:hypothetical protein